MSEENKKPRLLIIDDTPMMLSTLGNILKDDFTILVAKDGEKGIASAKKNKPVIILLDIMMPGMTGFEVIETLKADEETKNIPVILLTGDGTDESKEKGYALGAADYIEKPFVADVVREKVKVMSVE